MKFAIFSRLFSCCPSSLRRLRLQFVRFRAVEDERGNVVAVTRRQEPLINLKELSVWGILNWHSAIDIRSIFAHCPIINKLSLHDIKGHQETDEIEQFINKQCPRIESLNFGGHSWESFDPIPFRIMESLPPQQITELVYSGALPNDSKNNFKRLRSTGTRRRCDQLASIEQSFSPGLCFQRLSRNAVT